MPPAYAGGEKERERKQTETKRLSLTGGEFVFLYIQLNMAVTIH